LEFHSYPSRRCFTESFQTVIQGISTLAHPFFVPLRSQTMAKPAPSEKVVYLALRDIFTGQASQVRWNAAIEKVIQKHEQNAQVQNLIQDYGVEPIICIAKVLLKARVFESNTIARQRFPDAFGVPPVQNVQRTIPQAKVTINNATTVHTAKESCQDTVSGHQSKTVCKEKKKKIDIGKEIQW
jgi:hypothetical protein